jgi:hypothetical protein
MKKKKKLLCNNREIRVHKLRSLARIEILSLESQESFAKMTFILSLITIALTLL